MLTCYVIDDELHAIKSLIAYIEKTSLLQLIGYQENPVEALSMFQNTGVFPDILFLDVDMPQLSGIELASIITGKTSIVLTTAHPNFALEAFEMEISDYLLKPISFARFLKCINKLNDKFVDGKGKEQEVAADFVYIQTEGKGKYIRLFFHDIIMVESQKNYIAITTPERKHLTYLTLTEFEEKLPAAFLRINKSYVINTNKISHIEGKEVFLVNQKESIPLGVSYKETFLNYMKTHLAKTKRSNS